MRQIFSGIVSAFRAAAGVARRFVAAMNALNTALTLKPAMAKILTAGKIRNKPGTKPIRQDQESILRRH